MAQVRRVEGREDCSRHGSPSEDHRSPRVAVPEPASCAGWVPALTQRGTPLPSVTCGDPGRDRWAGALCLPMGFPSAAP